MWRLESSFTKLAGYRIRAIFLLEMGKLQQRCKDRKTQKMQKETTILFKETSLGIESD